MDTAITIGKFDGFHSGHKLLLDDILKVSDEKNLQPVLLMISSDEPRIFTIEEENELIRSLSGNKVKIIRIEFTPEFKAITAEDFIRKFLVEKYNVKHIAVGSNFRFGRDRAGDSSFLSDNASEYGFDVNVVEIREHDTFTVSSTIIRKMLSEGEMDTVNKLLGHNYLLSGTVEKGKALGRQLGFPTINIIPGDKKYLPRYGVYSSQIIIDGDRKYNGITNIGIRPSVDDGDIPNVETFIYDFSEDIYGSEVKICPTRFIRGEKAFKSIDELKEQIAKDIEFSRNI